MPLALAIFSSMQRESDGAAKISLFAKSLLGPSIYLRRVGEAQAGNCFHAQAIGRVRSIEEQTRPMPPADVPAYFIQV